MKYTPDFITISAKQGDPSVLWIGKSGRYYRTKPHAIEDNPAEAYPYKSPFNAALWTGVAVLAALAIGFFLYRRLKK